MDIDFDLTDVEAACRAFQSGMVTTAQHAVEAAAKAGVREAVATRRYKDRTGDLSKPTTEVAIRLADGAVSVMKWPVKYASFVDGGTKPHDINGKRGGDLVFFWAKAGRLFVGPKVRHPGTKAYGFAGVAYHKAEAVAYAQIDQGSHDAAATAFR